MDRSSLTARLRAELFSKSKLYRDDLWIGRYLAHPLAAWTHIPAGVALTVLLASNPGLDFGGWGWLFALVPGVWLFLSGIMFATWMMALGLGMPVTAALFADGYERWQNYLLSRGAAALPVVALLSGFAFSHTANISRAAPFDQEDFGKCVAILEPLSQVALAKNASVGMSRTKFWEVCRNARALNGPKPKSLEELKARLVPVHLQGPQS